MSADCNPYSRNLSDNLEHDEALRIFCTVSTQQQLICRAPPVLPKGGELYIFDLGEDSTKWDSWKRKFRCDQYRWVNRGVFNAKCSDGTTLKKRSNYIDREDLPRNKGDDQFRRWEFWGYGSYFILHYTGKDSIFTPFAHRGHKKDETARPFIRSAPFIKEKVTDSNSLQTDKQVYREIVNLDRGGPRHCIETPRNTEQVKNFRDAQCRQIRISHDALFNLYQLSFQLKFPNRRGDSTDFVSYISIHPRIIVHLLPHPVLESLEQLVKVQNKPTLLHYDTAFNVGDYYISILSFRHSLFRKEPIVPCAFLLHSRRYQSDHKDFIEAITEVIRPLKTKHVNLVYDREFKFASLFPVGSHLHCWNHFISDVRWYLRSNTDCTPEEVNIIINCFRDIMLSETEEDFDSNWEDIKNSAVLNKHDKVMQYFERNIMPSFKCHAAIWTLKSAGVTNAENGLTNNASESFNAVLRRLQQWKQVPADVIVTSLYHLCVYYCREIERSLHQCGQWSVKDEFNHLKREPSLLPYMDIAPSPGEIVEVVRRGIAVTVQADDTPSFSSSGHSANSDVMMAHVALANERVKLVENGSWMVTDSDCLSASVVRLFPKETCSCSSTRTCYHIMACRIMLGLPIEVSGKTNLLEMTRKDRQKKERPPGKKRPRKCDFAEPQCQNKQAKTQEKADTEPSSKCPRNDVIDTVEGSPHTDSAFIDGSDRIIPNLLVESAHKTNTDESTVPTANSNDSYLSCLLTSKQVNVIAKRAVLTYDNSSVDWSDFLKIVDKLSTGIIVATHVCQASFDYEVTHLSVGQAVVVQTTRSKQIASLRRVADEREVPVIEIISTYERPDGMELEYHAGVMLRRNASIDSDTFVAKHIGVQFTIESEGEADQDVLLAALVYHMCMNRSCSLDGIRLDSDIVRDEIVSFVSGNCKEGISCEYDDDSFCETQTRSVALHCLCRSPWVDGSTSLALFGKNQKKFNMHNCCRCYRWYHMHCLEMCNVKRLPKRTEDFVCPRCQYPEMLQWHHPQFTNTCTLDNIITIILTYCRQNTIFLNNLKSSAAENVLKSGLMSMLNGNLAEGKSTILEWVQSQLNLKRTVDGQYDCYGTEHDKFLCLFKHVWKLNQTRKCNSKLCPCPITERNLCTFELISANECDISYEIQIEKKFPFPGVRIEGYCGEKFSSCPPAHAPQAMNSTRNVDNDTTEIFFECRGTPEVISSSFLSGVPWMLPFHISSIRNDDVHQLIFLLPEDIEVYSRKYCLAGFTMISSGHITSVIKWKGEFFFYDGIKMSDTE